MPVCTGQFHFIRWDSCNHSSCLPFLEKTGLLSRNEACAAVFCYSCTAAPSLCYSFSQCDLAMPPLPHSLEYYAMLWQEACARGHGSSSCTPADDTGTAQDNVQQGVLLKSGRTRPPTPPKPKTTRTESSPPKQLMKIKPTTKPRTKFSKVELVWKKKDT